MTWCRRTPSAGVPRDVIEQQKEQIYSAATHNAKERVKVPFLLQKIAEKEDIKVSQEEIAAARSAPGRAVSDPAGQVPQGPAEAQWPDRSV